MLNDILVESSTYHYKGFHNIESKCKLEIFGDDCKYVVILSELSDFL